MARLKNYNYSRNGHYFVTVCTQDRLEWFGMVENGQMRLNEYGNAAQRSWLEIPRHFSNTAIDEFVVMPDHVHGIIVVKDNVGAGHARRLHRNTSPQKRQFQTIPVVIGSYKSAVARYIHVNGGGDFHWQKSFFDHVIRDDPSLKRIREYIRNNPKQWGMEGFGHARNYSN